MQYMFKISQFKSTTVTHLLTVRIILGNWKGNCESGFQHWRVGQF